MSIPVNGLRGGAAVVGADSFIGFRVAASLIASGIKVAAIGLRDLPDLMGAECRRTDDCRSFDLPPECGLVFYCHDVAQDRELHIQALSALCEQLAAMHSVDRQVHLCCFSSANVCNAAGCRIGEASELYPHCLRDAAVVQAEMLLRAWCCLRRNAVSPHVFRHGELYGEPSPFPTAAGHVNACLEMARHGRPLVFYGDLNQARTLTHVDDLARAATAAMLRGLVPGVVNVPGEKLSVVRYLMAISRHYGVDWEPVARRPEVPDENLPFPSGDRLLNSSLFKSIVPDFKPAYRFRGWLARQSRQ